MKVCPKCGRTEKEVPFIGFFCRDCYLEDHPLISIPPLKVKYCTSCESIYTDRWAEFSLDELSNWLRKKIKTANDSIHLSFSYPEVSEEGIRFIVLARGEVEGHPVEQAREGFISLEKTLCPVCSREHGGYYEAVIQIRGEDVEKHAEEVARLFLREGDRYTFISKVVDRKEGIDLYLGSRKAAEKVARKIERKYGIRPVKSYTLVTEKDGKKIYRVTIALHFK